MKILIITNSSSGLYGFRKELIFRLLKDNNEIIVLTPFSGREDKLLDIGCQIKKINMNRRSINPIKDLKLLFDYKKNINATRPDLIITYTIKPNIYGSILAKIYKIPCAVNITGLGTAFQKNKFMRALVIFLYKISLKKAKVVFFENVENKNVFVTNKIVSEEKAYCLNGAGVNLEDYQYSNYPKVENPIRFLFIGRIMEEKGINEYLYAAKKIKGKYLNVEFDIVGPMEDSHNTCINDYLKSNIVNYYGYQEDVKPFIQRCSCFVLPSYHEGMANTLLEAAAMGRPLITTNIHGCLETVNKNNSGFLINSHNGEALYNAIVDFINLPYENKIRMGVESRKHVEKYFNKKDIVNATVKKLME